MAKELAKGRICAVSVEGMTFHSPVKVGDVVCCYGRCLKKGGAQTGELGQAGAAGK